jgi:hypothetical protein
MRLVLQKAVELLYCGVTVKWLWTCSSTNYCTVEWQWSDCGRAPLQIIVLRSDSEVTVDMLLYKLLYCGVTVKWLWTCYSTNYCTVEWQWSDCGRAPLQIIVLRSDSEVTVDVLLYKLLYSRVTGKWLLFPCFLLPLLLLCVRLYQVVPGNARPFYCPPDYSTSVLSVARGADCYMTPGPMALLYAYLGAIIYWNVSGYPQIFRQISTERLAFLSI